MALRVYLDSTLLTNTPIGWDKAKIKSKRDKDIRGLFTNYTTDLEFWGDGFDYLDNILNQDYCQTVEVTIDSNDCTGEWETEFNGTIALTQITKYDVERKTITTKILDESFDAKINNNKSLKAFVDVGTSKNGEDITPVTPVDISFFLPTANFNTYIGTAREGYRVYDCFRFIIDYMTDGGVDFVSDVFGSSGEYYNWFLFTGSEIRVGAGNGRQLEVSFKELFIELHKKTNLSFAIEPNPSGYTNQFRIRIEPTEYFEQDDAVITLSDVLGIEMEFDKEALYSNVEIGSDDFDDNVVLSYPPLNFKAFKEENYTILGQCNVDETLDLVSKYIIDSNVIEDILVNSVDKYDRKNFLVVTDGSNAIKYKEYGDPVSYGTITTVTSNKLTDSSANFIIDGVAVGDMAFNVDTGQEAEVTNVDSTTVLSLSSDIFTGVGENYQVKDSPFNYNHPLTNIEVIERFLGGLPNSVIKHISSSSSANFLAGITSEVNNSSYPQTINYVEYDDDSTPPFFDDGANYDTSNYYYSVPSSGLYGFEAESVIRFNGQLDSTELVTNGDFSSGSTGWTFWQSGAAITTYYSHTNSGNINQLFLRQNYTFTGGNIYVITFDCTVDCGAILFNNPYATGDTYVTNGGTKTVVIDYTNVTTLQIFSQGLNRIEFRFSSVAGQTGFCFNNSKVTIDNVSMKTTPKFEVTQTIERKSSNNVLLQSFPDTYDIIFTNGQFQRLEVFNTQRTFSTFVGERISVKLEVNETSGSNTSNRILTNYFDLLTEQTHRTSFRTISVDDGGGDLLPVDPATYPIYKYKFTKAITSADFKLIKDDPKRAILFSKNKQDYIFGWRNSIERDRETGITEFELRAKKKINASC